MQFVRHGPDIPERLIQAQEEGRVVFFCGAGISYPAHLPGFAGLVKNVYSELAVTPNAVQKAAIKAKQYDTAMGLLESEIIGGRETVRRALVKALTPNLSAPGATATHEALLTLGRSRDGRTRLITTNFDWLFEEVIAAKALSVERFRAPLLPVPKNRWDGLVYLHGLLPTNSTSNELDRLVVSSGDFGLAYLTERWAARFVGELFRNYTVCFVGYSINDPVLRYMMDALAADRLLGETPPEMFAFGSHSKGKEKVLNNEWRSKNVTPILYREHSRHYYLHKTLRVWAETYRDGIRGKERIVVECAIARPLGSTRQDDFVGRLLWALSDPSGLPARRFAELDPVPSLDWLEPLSDGRYRHGDLGRFGVASMDAVDDRLAFSLICRPSPYQLAPLMSIVDAGFHGSRWDEVMRQLARWLIRHLDNPALLLWFAKRGGVLHHEMIQAIESHLEKQFKIQRAGNSPAIARIRANAPDEIPSSPMYTLWRMLLAGRITSRLYDLELFRWRQRFERDGLTTELRLTLRAVLTPKISLREPFSWPGEAKNSHASGRIRDLVEWEIVLSTSRVHSGLRDLRRNERWKSSLPELLPDLSGLLRDALDLMRELGGADDRSDLSYLHHPSISEHQQNNHYRDWTALIDLTRDAWLAAAAQSPESAESAAEVWSKTPYPLFRRLAFFSAAQGDVVRNRRALDWLLADGHWWLWSVETEREAMRLLVALAPRLDQVMLLELEEAILAGPMRSMFNENIEPERWARIVDREIWLRLAKVSETGAVLSIGQERLDALLAEYPDWVLAADQRDEFPSWTSDGNEGRQFIVTPGDLSGLVRWLRNSPDTSHWQEDDWQQRCREDFGTTFFALWILAQDGVWPTGRWREAFQAWSEEGLVNQSWCFVAPLLNTLPDQEFRELAHSLSVWLRSAAHSFEGYESEFFILARRILDLDLQDGISSDEPVMRAINHPVGHVTEALLRWWYRSSLEDGQGLLGEIRSIFSELCETQIEKFRHGRVLLTAHVISLFRVDEDWTKQYLIPLFEWHRSEAEARAAWAGFLWAPRLHLPLMDVLKSAFLETACHYSSLGKHGGQYASLLTYAALDPGDTFTSTELANATGALPPEGLRDAAHALVRSLEGAGDRRADYWANRVVPYLHAVWPKSKDAISPQITESLGRICVEAREAFPEALGLLRGWLRPPSDPDYLVHLLREGDLCTRFPEEALEFLDLVIGGQTLWAPNDLSECLNAIRIGAPLLEADQRFERLVFHLRRYGQW